MYGMCVWQVCAGLYPNIVRIEEPAAGAKPVKGQPKSPKLFTQTMNDPKPTAVSIHPCSVNYNRSKFPTKWMVRTPHPPSGNKSQLAVTFTGSLQGVAAG
jgi:hypothetical protein